MNTMLSGAVIGFAVGIILGAVNHGLLRLTVAHITRARSQAVAAVTIVYSYALRYAMILGLILWMIRRYNARLALGCLLGMLMTTIGLAVCTRSRKKTDAATPSD